MTDQPQFSFGVIADVQYCDCEPATAMNRYFRRSTDKLKEALATLAQHDLRFILDLGDLIDRDFDSFDTVLSIYKEAKVPVHRTLGNHDYTVNVTRVEEVTDKLSMSTTGYYVVDYDDWKLVVLNGTEVSLFATRAGTPGRTQAEAELERLNQQNAPQAKEWNAGISTTQLNWLNQQLSEAQDAGQTVIVTGHYPLYPTGPLNLWNDRAVTEVLARYSNVVAYFNGHHHDGNYGQQNHVHYLNFKGMVDTPEENTFAVVHVHPDRLEVEGFGREETRTLARSPY